MVRWAPFDVPLRRRLQMAAVVCAGLFPMAVFSTLALSCYFSLPRAVLIAAIAWQLIVDRQTPSRGGRPWAWIRSNPFLRLVAEYFSATLILPPEAPFDPSRVYLFALHPHGIISASAICNLVFNVNRPLERLGVPYRVCTVTANFIVPLWREFVLAFGFVRADRASVAWCLEHGTSIALVIGGAKESLQARPGSTELTLADRKGFVRIALAHGAALVPCFSFGEVELFSQVDNPPGSWVRWVQDTAREWLGFTTPFFSGRGIFNYDVGLVPRRIPLTTVVGTPILLERTAQPSQAQVDAVHAQYIAALRALYAENAPKYLVDKEGCRVVAPQPLIIS